MNKKTIKDLILLVIIVLASFAGVNILMGLLSLI
jgi:hypothetical protein